jgi:hypothetical protein
MRKRTHRFGRGSRPGRQSARRKGVDADIPGRYVFHVWWCTHRRLAKGTH